MVDVQIPLFFLHVRPYRRNQNEYSLKPLFVNRNDRSSPSTKRCINSSPELRRNHSRSSFSAMDDLPPSLVIEILDRLADSADLARCRVASKSLNALSRDVRSVNLFCSLNRYLKSRAVETKLLVTPFKVILKTLMSEFVALDSVSIGVEKSLGRISYEHDDVEDWSDDLFLTDAGFAREWLPAIGRDLTSLSIVDFWVQSCWRQSKILALITSCCEFGYRIA